MKKKSGISLGPGASSLILIFVVLSMSILGMLSLMTARNDLNLSRRSAEATEKVYQLKEAAEVRRAAVAGLLASGGAQALETALTDDPRLSGMTLEEGQLSWSETDGSRTLDCLLLIDGGKTAWAGQTLSTNISEDTAEAREAAARLALTGQIVSRKAALDLMLENCAGQASDWADYLRRVSEAMRNEPMAEGVTLTDNILTWIETDGTYRYACTVEIHPLDAERRSDFSGTPVSLDDESTQEEFID